MSAPMDVLAVLRMVSSAEYGVSYSDAAVQDQVREARSAVAELIETSAAALQYMRLHRYADQAWADDLAAALARVQGVSA